MNRKPYLQQQKKKNKLTEETKIQPKRLCKCVLSLSFKNAEHCASSDTDVTSETFLTSGQRTPDPHVSGGSQNAGATSSSASFIDVTQSTTPSQRNVTRLREKSLSPPLMPDLSCFDIPVSDSLSHSQPSTSQNRNSSLSIQSSTGSSTSEFKLSPATIERLVTALDTIPFVTPEREAQVLDELYRMNQ